jgi:hypothetical protein
MLAPPMGSIPVQLLELEVKGEKGRKEGEEEERSRRNQLMIFIIHRQNCVI